ncbi:sodium channel modifier 1-like [Ornithodoros turicata]|uniref:sodium channel modifier 1-like n=1 Tax=Ornithodoros turicata TaxID=34597 RepID=UPI0031388958
MAFKREGTDTALLQDLHQRRVSELLVEKIPDDEAFLLKNGKYACTLCPHRPVLDTIEMLAVHRKGKKHLFSLSRHLAREHRKKEEATKRIQELQLKQELRTPLGSHKAAKCLGQVSAKSSMKRPRLKLMKSAKYNSCCGKKGGTNGTEKTVGSGHAKQSEQSCSNPLVNTYVQQLQHKKSFQEAIESKRRNTVSQLCGQDCVAGGTPIRVSSIGKGHATASDQSLSEEERAKNTAKAQHYLNLRMAGWLLNPEGKWVKDENVEFDSDEEEPPAFSA